MKNKNQLDDEYTSLIENISFQPVFILGLHRSGTTILYKMLNETRKLNVLTAYHILNYDELIYNYLNKLETKKKEEINKLLKEKGITNRKTDHIKVTANYAHEYMYIFSERNLPLKVTSKNKWLFEEMCKKIQYISGNNNYLLLKNPLDYSNFLFINFFYPHAKFIFIHRNPLYVISSIMRLWKTNLENKNEYTALFSKQHRKLFQNPVILFLARMYYISRAPIGLFSIIHHCKKDTKYFLKNINQLSKEDYINVNYETLCKNPNEAIGKIMKFLKIKTDEKIDFRSFIVPRNLPLETSIIKMRRYIYKRMKSYFNFFGYTIKQ